MNTLYTYRTWLLLLLIALPTLVLAASSIDDVFVIVIYSVLVGIYTGQHVSLLWKLAGRARTAAVSGR